MLSKKNSLTICIIVVLFSFSFSMQVDAKPFNVVDCMGENADCEEMDGTTPAESEDDQTESMIEVGNTGSLLFDLIKMFFALMLVLALIYLLLKFLNKRNKLFNQVKALENLGGVSVGQNKSIQIVRIGKKFYLIGVGDNVEMLQEITDEEVKKDLIERDENEANNFNAGALLPSFLQPKSDGDNKDSNNQTKHEFKNLFSNELEKLKKNRGNIIKQHKQKEDNHE